MPKVFDGLKAQFPSFSCGVHIKTDKPNRKDYGPVLLETEIWIGGLLFSDLLPLPFFPSFLLYLMLSSQNPKLLGTAHGGDVFAPLY